MPESVKFGQLEEFGFGPNIMRKTKICISCGRATSAENTMCLLCGKRLTGNTLFDYYKRMHVCCPVCDTILTSDARYCPHCGTKLDDH